MKRMWEYVEEMKQLPTRNDKIRYMHRIAQDQRVGCGTFALVLDEFCKSYQLVLKTEK
jgi:hypothetical protein